MTAEHSRSFGSQESSNAPFPAERYNPLVGGARPRSPRSPDFDEENIEPGIDDRELLRSLKVSIHEHRTLDASRVSIEVKHGEVILAGPVDSPEVKGEIEKLARGTPCVLRVTNQMTVEPKEHPAHGS